MSIFNFEGRVNMAVADMSIFNFDGDGTLTFPDGSIAHQGEWKNDKPHGQTAVTGKQS